MRGPCRPRPSFRAAAGTRNPALRVPGLLVGEIVRGHRVVPAQGHRQRTLHSIHIHILETRTVHRIKRNRVPYRGNGHQIVVFEAPQPHWALRRTSPPTHSAESTRSRRLSASMAKSRRRPSRTACVHPALRVRYQYTYTMSLLVHRRVGDNTASRAGLRCLLRVAARVFSGRHPCQGSPGTIAPASPPHSTTCNSDGKKPWTQKAQADP